MGRTVTLRGPPPFMTRELASVKTPRPEPPSRELLARDLRILTLVATALWSFIVLVSFPLNR